jgi:ParB family protein of integrating conjugative element (PFGI_1 class)
MPRGASVAALAATGSVKSKRRDAVVQGLGLGFPSERSSDADYGDPVAETQMIVTIDELHPYDRNPRRTAPNPQYHEIKESIRHSGLHNTLTITRRPGEQFYIIESGGNTRLQILRELWEETRDEKFYRLSVVFKPWKKESAVLAKHLIENNVRGDMTFWDNANGFMELKVLLEEETGQGVSLRQFEEVLRMEGVSCNKSDLAKFGFAVKYLKYLGGALPFLPSRAVAEIQPRFNLLKRFAEKHSGLSEDVLYEEVLGPAMLAYGERLSAAEAEGDKANFDTDALMALCEESLASRCEVELTWLQTVLEGLKRNPDSPIEELAKPVVPQKPDSPSVDPKDGAGESAAEERRPAKAKESKEGGEEALPPGEDINADLQEEGAGRGPAASSPFEALPQGGATVIPAASPQLEAEELLPAIIQDIGLFAQHVGVMDALRHDDALPFGFWMEMIAIDAGADALKHIGWWVLCTLSGQLHGEFTQRLPEDATWRVAMESDQDAVDHTLGGLPDFLHFHHIWALDGFPPEVFDIYVRLLGSMRWLKNLHPERFEQLDVTGGEE